jgi:hypothetical protein
MPTSALPSLADFTEDEFDRELLLSEQHATIHPGDPMYDELGRQMARASNLTAALTPKRREIARQWLTAATQVDIAERVGCSMTTVSKALKDPLVRDLIGVYQRINTIYQGPKQQERANLLWRIALNNEDTNPKTSIQAVDVLNKMDHTYHPEEDAGDKRLIVNIKEFVINQTGPALPQDNPPPATDVIEGEFTPITVATPDA